MTSMLLLDEQYFLPLIKELTNKDRVNTLQLVGFLRSTVENKRKVKCYVDEWPVTATTVLVLPVDNMHGEDTCTIYTADKSKLRRMLRVIIRQNTFDWSKDVVFSGNQPLVMDLVSHILTEESIQYERHPGFLVYEPDPASRTSEQLPPPNGYRFSSLREEHVDFVTSCWEYAEHDSHLFVSFIIRNYTTVSLETDEGQLVGWYVAQPDGSMGMLYVQPMFRGIGLGKSLVKQLGNVLLQKEKLPFTRIHETNDVSLRLHKSCGYNFTTAIYEWILVKPEES